MSLSVPESSINTPSSSSLSSFPSICTVVTGVIRMKTYLSMMGAALLAGNMAGCDVLPQNPVSSSNRQPGFSDSNSENTLDDWGFDPNNKDLINVLTLNDIKITTLAHSPNQEKVVSAVSILKDLMDSFPIPPVKNVRKLVLVFGEEGEGLHEEGTKGLTPIDRSDGVQYVFFAFDADEATIKHELIHALYQSDKSKTLPDFINEGAVHALANPDPGYREYSVMPEYLLTLSGVLPETGNLSQGENPSDADFLQYDVLQAFWDEVTEIDPSLPYRLLRPNEVPKKPLTLQQIPAFLLANCSPKAAVNLADFLNSCSIFDLPKGYNLFILPDADNEYPEVTIYYVNEDHLALPERVPVWYESSFSPVSTSPIMTSSNTALEFTKFPLTDRYNICVTAINPGTMVPQRQSFEFIEADQIWSPITAAGAN